MRKQWGNSEGIKLRLQGLPTSQWKEQEVTARTIHFFYHLGPVIPGHTCGPPSLS